MPSVNRVHLLGHLTRDPELRYLPSQTEVASFGMAMNRKFKTAAGEAKEDVTFVDCECFGRAAQIVHQHMRKGQLVYLEGRLKLDQWDDRNGGGRRSKLSVVVETFQFLGMKNGNGEAQKAGKPAVASPIEEEPIFDDQEIPF